MDTSLFTGDSTVHKKDMVPAAPFPSVKLMFKMVKS